MTHEQFVRAYQQRQIQVIVDRAAAARLVSGRMLLPFVLLPLLGLGVALALVGYLFTGIAVFVAAIALRFVVRASSQGFVLSRALQDPAFYEQVRSRNILLVKQS